MTLNTVYVYIEIVWNSEYFYCTLYGCFCPLHLHIYLFQGLEKIPTKKRNDAKKQAQKIVEKRYSKILFL